MELKTYFAQDAAGNIISSAIVNVFLQGTTTLATGLTRADGTPLENPFAADGAGRIQFRAPDGYYDVQVSAGPGIIQTLTIQCVDYAEAKADADRAETAADRAEDAADYVEGKSAIIIESLRRSYAENGYNLVAGSFETGGEINTVTDVLLYEADGKGYSWGGVLPKSVPAGSTPINSGGIGVLLWSDRSSEIVTKYQFPAGTTPAPVFTRLPKSLIGVDIPEVQVTLITPLTSTIQITVSDPTNFVVGAYAFIKGNLTVAGCFKVLGKTGSVIELAFYHGFIDTSVSGVTAKPIVSIVNVVDNDGLQLTGEVETISNIVIDATGKAYGIVVGSKYEAGLSKSVCSVESANHVHIEGGSRVALCVGGGGSSFGIDNISVGGCGIGILSAYGGSVVGTGAYAYNAGEDVFKCEHSGDMYITSHNAIKTTSGSIYGSRYASAQEMSNGFAVCSGGDSLGTSQFNAYLSLRTILAKGNATYGVNSVDGGAVALSGVDASAMTGAKGVRARNNSTVRTVTGNSSFNGFTSLTEILESTVELNGTAYSGKSVLATISVGTISANARFAQQRTVTGFKPSNNLPINMTVNADLPAGIIPFAVAYGDNLIRVVFHNVTGASVDVGDIPVLLSW